MRMRGQKAIVKAAAAAEESGKPASKWIEEMDPESGWPYCTCPLMSHGRG